MLTIVFYVGIFRVLMSSLAFIGVPGSVFSCPPCIIRQCGGCGFPGRHSTDGASETLLGVDRVGPVEHMFLGVES